MMMMMMMMMMMSSLASAYERGVLELFHKHVLEQF